MAATNRSRRRPRRRKLMMDTAAPSLGERCRAYRARGLLPDETEFDRVRLQVMTNYLRLLDKLRCYQAAPEPNLAGDQLDRCFRGGSTYPLRPEIIDDEALRK
jgi:hypothetical protein